MASEPWSPNLIDLSKQQYLFVKYTLVYANQIRLQWCTLNPMGKYASRGRGTPSLLTCDNDYTLSTAYNGTLHMNQNLGPYHDSRILGPWHCLKTKFVLTLFLPVVLQAGEARKKETFQVISCNSVSLEHSKTHTSSCLNYGWSRESKRIRK